MRTMNGVIAILTFAGWASSASAVPITDFVTVGNQQWAQPDDFTSLSWDDIFSVCGTGTCSGDLTSDSGTYTMNGWNWAGVDAVNGLFNSYLTAAGGTASGYPLAGPSVVSEPNSTWAPQFLSDFNATDFAELNHYTVKGLTSSTNAGQPQFVYYAEMRDSYIPSGIDAALTERNQFPDRQSSTIGAWFVRDVPVPGTLFLLALGLLGLRISRQRTV